MLVKLSIILFAMMMGLSAHASRDTILFVSASQASKQLARGDYASSQKAAEDFKQLVEKANASLPEASRPLIVNLEVRTLYEIPGKLPADAHVRMIFFMGHGNGFSFFLDDTGEYRGLDIANILMSEKMRPLLAPDVGLYFGACRCGQDFGASNFQTELMVKFRNLNEALAPAERTQSLVSIAHRFSSVRNSFKAGASGFETFLYKKGVFQKIENFDYFMFKKLGRYLSPFAGVGVTMGLYYLANTMSHFVNPETVTPAIQMLLAALPKVTVGLGLAYYGLSTLSTKWAQRLEYTSGKPNISRGSVAAGVGVAEIIRVTERSCEGLF